MKCTNYRWQRQQRQQWLWEATFLLSVVRRLLSSRTAFFTVVLLAAAFIRKFLVLFSLRLIRNCFECLYYFVRNYSVPHYCYMGIGVTFPTVWLAEFFDQTPVDEGTYDFARRAIATHPHEVEKCRRTHQWHAVLWDYARAMPLLSPDRTIASTFVVSPRG